MEKPLDIEALKQALNSGRPIKAHPSYVGTKFREARLPCHLEKIEVKGSSFRLEIKDNGGEVISFLVRPDGRGINTGSPACVWYDDSVSVSTNSLCKCGGPFKIVPLGIGGNCEFIKVCEKCGNEKP